MTFITKSESAWVNFPIDVNLVQKKDHIAGNPKTKGILIKHLGLGESYLLRPESRE